MAEWIDFVQRVKSANDIVDVIGSYIDVVQRGNSFWARCPFHGEKTPSFSISRKGFYKCFGCGESGDVISFVEKFESVTFMEAVEILAKRANIEMPVTENNKSMQELSDKKKLKDKQYALIREAGVYYFKNFYSQVGASAKAYMQGRGFSADTIKAFGIGYSPNMSGLVSHLTATGHDLDMAVKLGVLSRSKRDNGCYDAMCGRLVVPVINIYNKVIAFGGRALDDKTAQFGKYKNTGESPVFAKTNNLYAINMAKKAKQNANLPYIIMVEGYMDVIAMAQAGYEQCVASMGTSLTQPQAKLLSRLVDKVYICYDGDSAGQKATLRGLDILTTEGLEVFVMSVPDNLDPDEYIGKHGKQAFGKLLEQALPLIDYKLQYLHNFYKLGQGTKEQNNLAITKYISACLQLLSSMDDVTQRHYAKVVANISGYTEDFIYRKLSNNVTVIESNSVAEDSIDKVYYHIASCMLSSSAYELPASKIVCDMQALNNVFDYIWQCSDNGTTPQVDMIYTLCSDQEQSYYTLLLEMQDKPVSDSTVQYYNDCLSQVQLMRLKSDRQMLSHKLKQSDIDSQQFLQITQKIQLLDEQISLLLTD